MEQIVDSYIYNSDDILARGAFSEIFKGKHQKSNEVIAIKVVEILGNINIHLDEWELLSQGNHENIVRLLEFIENDKKSFFIMDFCNAKDLHSYLKKNDRISDEKSLAHIFHQIAKGLSFIACMDVVHLNLKPSNILFSNPTNKQNPELFDFIVKISDFESARYIGSSYPIRIQVGTISYTAPEVHKSPPYNKKSDCWSFGIILFESYFGFVPKSLIEYIKLHKTSPKAIFRLVIPKGCPSLLADLLNKLIKAKPEERIDVAEINSHPFFGTRSLIPKQTVYNIDDILNMLDDRCDHKYETKSVHFDFHSSKESELLGLSSKELENIKDSRILVKINDDGDHKNSAHSKGNADEANTVILNTNSQCNENREQTVSDTSNSLQGHTGSKTLNGNLPRIGNINLRPHVLYKYVTDPDSVRDWFNKSRENMLFHNLKNLHRTE